MHLDFQTSTCHVARANKTLTKSFTATLRSAPSLSRASEVAGVFLALLLVTGLGLLFYLKNVRLPALIIMAVGVTITLALMKLARLIRQRFNSPQIHLPNRRNAGVE